MAYYGFTAKVGPYELCDSSLSASRTIGDFKFTYGIAGAYNAFGLIGPEYNGIFVVLEEPQKSVVLDQHLMAQTGYFGPSTEQRAEFERLKAATDEGFLTFVLANKRLRDDVRRLLQQRETA